MNRALFVVLNGTLITTRSGRPSPLHSDDWKFNDICLDAIKYFKQKGFKIILISNEEGIELGYSNKILVTNKFETVCNSLEKHLNFKKNSVCYTFCSKQDSYYSRPNPGMAFDMALEYELSLNQSILISNEDYDKYFKANSGIGTLYNLLDLVNLQCI